MRIYQIMMSNFQHLQNVICTIVFHHREIRIINNFE
jgi:hypothetical protein